VVQSEERWKFNPKQIEHLIQIWGHISKLDGTISHMQLVKLVRSILPPIGVGPTANYDQAVEFISRISIIPLPLPSRRYTFNHTVFALVSAVAEVPMPCNASTRRLQQKIGQHFSKVCDKADEHSDCKEYDGCLNRPIATAKLQDCQNVRVVWYLSAEMQDVYGCLKYH
jgi:hypothetical protein